MMANFVGRCGAELVVRSRVSACLCVSATLRAEIAVKRFGSAIWQAPIVWLLQKKFVPRLCAGAGLPVPKEWLTAWSIPEMDTRVIVPAHGYKCAEDYYKDLSAGSSGNWRSIAIPILFLHALDDPVFHIDDTAVAEYWQGNSNIAVLVTSTGGHVGWPADRVSRWELLASIADRFYTEAAANEDGVRNLIEKGIRGD